MNNKTLAAILVGETCIWYDFIIFMNFSSLIFKDTIKEPFTYFPLFLSICIVPFGALFWGYISDKKGYSISLNTTPILMLISSVLVLISENFTYSFFLLLLSRAIQGFCIGGDSTANSILIYNNSPFKRKYLNSTFCGMTSIIGFFIALLTAYIIKNHYGSENWKIAFIFSIFITLFSLFLRLKFINRYSINININYKKLDLLMILKLFLFSTISFSFIGYIFYFKIEKIPHYLVSKEILNSKNIELYMSYSMLINIPFMLLASIFCDRFNKYKYLPYIISMIIIPFLIYNIYNSHSLISYFFYDAIYALASSAIIPTIINYIPLHLRNIIFGLSFNLSFGFFAIFNLLNKDNKILNDTSNNTFLFILFVASIASIYILKRLCNETTEVKRELQHI